MAGGAGRARFVVDGGSAFHPLGKPWRLAATARPRTGAPRAAWHAFVDAPASGHTTKQQAQAKRGSARQRDRREALGRSRGGYGTKACVGADGSGRAVAFSIAPGQAHELPLAPALLGRLPRVSLWNIADRGYSSNRFRQLVWDRGARPAIPTKINEAPVACPEPIYHNRNMVERLWARLKEWRAVATRYEKTGTSFMGVLCMAATANWLKP